MPFDEPSDSAVARVGLAFAEALARGDWSAAHAMLASSLRDELGPSDLEREFDDLIGYWKMPAGYVELLAAEDARAYVSICSDSHGTYHEAIDVRLVCYEGSGWLIDDIIWGRP